MKYNDWKATYNTILHYLKRDAAKGMEDGVESRPSVYHRVISGKQLVT